MFGLRVIELPLSGTFKGHKIGVNFWSRDFFGFCWKPQGFFFGLDFWLHSIISVN